MRRIIDQSTERVPPILKILWRIRWALGSLVILLCTFVLGSGIILLRPFDQRGQQAFATFRAWNTIVRSVYGLSVTRRGSWPTDFRGQLVVSNHRSYMDIPALFACIPGPLTFVLKSSLTRIPFWGWIVGAFMIAAGGGPAGARRVLAQSESKLKAGHPVLYFPEGHRTTTGNLMPLRSGVFRLAAALSCPLNVVYLAGTDTAMRRGTLVATPAEVSATFLGCIEAKDDAAAMQSACEAMLNAHEALEKTDNRNAFNDQEDR